MEDLFKKLNAVIENNRTFILTSHVHSDGNALGSLIAFHEYLSGQGKIADIIVPGELPAKYKYLNTDQLVNQSDLLTSRRKISDADVIFILDISSLDRLAEYQADIEQSGALKVCIDHHPLQAAGIDIMIVNTGRVATAEMVYEYFKFSGASISLTMADALYTAILSDSGGFRFEGTSTLTLQMAAHLLEIGVNPALSFNRIYECGSHNQLKAWGKILSQTESADGLSWAVISKAQLDSYGISLAELDGFVNVMRKNSQATVFIVFVEKDKNDILVGLRSRNGLNVGRVAESFGGGGHRNASGFTSNQTLDEVVKQTIQTIRSLS